MDEESRNAFSDAVPYGDREVERAELALRSKQISGICLLELSLQVHLKRRLTVQSAELARQSYLPA